MYVFLEPCREVKLWERGAGFGSSRRVSVTCRWCIKPAPLSLSPIATRISRSKASDFFFLGDCESRPFVLTDMEPQKIDAFPYMGGVGFFLTSVSVLVPDIFP